jgi:Protein of unknown function (DUF2905)
MAQAVGRILIVVGGLMLFVGLVLTLGGRIPLLGRLPGDIVIRRGSFTLYFPIVTGLVLSLLLTVLLSLFSRR